MSTSSEADGLKRLAACAMLVDALMPGGWTVIDPQHVDPEAERVYRAWREFERGGRTPDLPEQD